MANSVISNQFSDQDQWNAYARLLTDVLRVSVKDETIHSKFCRVTDMASKPISIQLKALRGFANKYHLLDAGERA